MIRASTLVKTAALAMVGTSLLIFPAAAQQVAVNAPDTPNFSACDQISRTNPAEAIQCRLDTLKAHTAAVRQETTVAEKQIQSAEQEGQCVDRIKSELAAGHFTADAVRARLAGRKILEVGACNLLGMLTRS